MSISTAFKNDVSFVFRSYQLTFIPFGFANSSESEQLRLISEAFTPLMTIVRLKTGFLTVEVTLNNVIVR